MTLPASAKTLIILTFVVCGFFSTNDTFAAKTPPEKVAAPDAMELRRLDIEERKLALEREKLTHEKEKDTQDFNLEKERAWWSAISIPLSIFVPLILGVGAYGLQIWSQSNNEKLQFKLKAAEIAMNARDSNQVQAKAAILKTLFQNELKSFEPQKDFTPSEFPFSQSIESREALVALLAENPNSRKEIIQAWAAMFPWDSDPEWTKPAKTEEEKEAIREYKKQYRWFEELRQTFGGDKPGSETNAKTTKA